MDQLSKDDQSAFDELFRSYYRYLVTIAYGYTQDFQLSKDLAQEVFLDVWKRRSTLKINTSIRAFLKRAVINQANTANKKNKHNDPIENTEHQLKGTDNAQHAMEYDELNLKISAIVENLPERCRAVFKLSRYENLSHKEIAARLDISTKTIENQMTKALKVLRSGLKKDNFISITLLITLYA